MIKEVECGIFPFQVLICLDETKKSVVNFIYKNYRYKLDKREMDGIGLSETKKGRTVFLKNNAMIVMASREDVKTIIHELVHVAMFVLTEIGTPINQENDEVLAHFIGYLFEQVQPMLKNRSK